MSKFKHSGTGVVVSVSDEKDDRFGADWVRVDGKGDKPARVPKSDKK